MRMVWGQGLVLLIAGVSLGVITGAAIARALASQLFAVSPGDPRTFVEVSALLAAVSVVACYIPGRRAMQVDPMVLLRSE